MAKYHHRHRHNRHHYPPHRRDTHPPDHRYRHRSLEALSAEKPRLGQQQSLEDAGTTWSLPSSSSMTLEELLAHLENVERQQQQQKEKRLPREPFVLQELRIDAHSLETLGQRSLSSLSSLSSSLLRQSSTLALGSPQVVVLDLSSVLLLLLPTDSDPTESLVRMITTVTTTTPLHQILAHVTQGVQHVEVLLHSPVPIRHPPRAISEPSRWAAYALPQQQQQQQLLKALVQALLQSLLGRRPPPASSIEPPPTWLRSLSLRGSAFGPSSFVLDGICDFLRHQQQHQSSFQASSCGTATSTTAIRHITYAPCPCAISWEQQEQDEDDDNPTQGLVDLGQTLIDIHWEGCLTISSAIDDKAWQTIVSLVSHPHVRLTQLELHITNHRYYQDDENSSLRLFSPSPSFTTALEQSTRLQSLVICGTTVLECWDALPDHLPELLWRNRLLYHIRHNDMVVEDKDETWNPPGAWLAWMAARLVEINDFTV